MVREEDVMKAALSLFLSSVQFMQGHGSFYVEAEPLRSKQL